MSHTGIDPLYSDSGYSPKPQTGERWLYREGEYESFVLSKMRRRVKELKLLVGYGGFFRPPSCQVWYRHPAPKKEYRTNGEARVLSAKPFHIVVVTAVDTDKSIPALSSSEEGWEASLDGICYSSVRQGGIPSGDELVRVELEPGSVAGHEGLYDMGREILGEITFASENKPQFSAGESLIETLETGPGDMEQTFETVPIGEGRWKTPNLLAFRYLQVKDPHVSRFSVSAAFTPLVYRRTYDFGDDELNRIWEASAYTLRLCIDTFQIDGIKRDRLPWGGDLAISLLSNAFSFREPEPVRRTLTVLSRDGVNYSHANGILDYSLWIVVSHLFYQRSFGDLPFLAENKTRIIQILEWFLARMKSDGGFVAPRTDVQPGIDDEWCFIDWVSAKKTTALQMILSWALKAGGVLMRMLSEESLAQTYEEEARLLDGRINGAAFDKATGLYRSDVFDPESEPGSHPNFLYFLAGIKHPGASAEPVAALIGSSVAPPGTPYMIALEVLALHKAGMGNEALALLRRVWGGMLKLGATTFFEGYSDGFTPRSSLEFYGRPFGMSLCHAWSSAPVALLPAIFGKGEIAIL